MRMFGGDTGMRLYKLLYNDIPKEKPDVRGATQSCSKLTAYSSSQ